ncbi:MAG: hypothetical protein ACI9KE_002464, partial [Polyangiales bacterium]
VVVGRRCFAQAKLAQVEVDGVGSDVAEAHLVLFGLRGEQGQGALLDRGAFAPLLPMQRFRRLRVDAIENSVA